MLFNSETKPRESYYFKNVFKTTMTKQEKDLESTQQINHILRKLGIHMGKDNNFELLPHTIQKAYINDQKLDFNHN